MKKSKKKKKKLDILSTDDLIAEPSKPVKRDNDEIVVPLRKKPKVETTNNRFVKI